MLMFTLPSWTIVSLCRLYSCFEKVVPQKLISVINYATTSKGVMGNGGVRCLDGSYKVFQRGKRKKPLTRCLLLPFPSC